MKEFFFPILHIPFCPVFTHAVKRQHEEGNNPPPPAVPSTKCFTLLSQTFSMKNSKIIIFSVITLFWVLIKNRCFEKYRRRENFGSSNRFFLFSPLAFCFLSFLFFSFLFWSNDRSRYKMVQRKNIGWNDAHVVPNNLQPITAKEVLSPPQT